MKIGLRLNGKAIGVDPNTGLQFPVYTNRDSVGEWEELQLTPHGGGLFDAYFIASNRQLTLTQDGKLESRLKGAIGSWELFYATQQPDDHGLAFLYRVNDTDVLLPVLTIENRE